MAEDVRGELAAALRDLAHWCEHSNCASCQMIPDEEFDATIWATAMHEHQVTEVQGNVTALADALLPVVDRIARKRAAEELRAAADAVALSLPGFIGRIDTADAIRDRAAALDAEAGPSAR